MNWGGFADGFSRGFNNGMAIGKNVTDAMKQKKIEDVRAQGIAEAQAAQSKAIADLVKDNGVPKAPEAPAAAPSVAPAAAGVEVEAVPVPKPEQIETRPLEPVNTTPAAAAAAATPPSPAPATPATAAAPTPEVKVTPIEAPAQPAQAEAPASPAAAGLPQPPKAQKRFSVGDASFDTREEAEAYAKKNAPSVMDFMAKTLVPKMTEAYVAQGDMEKAAAWEKWAEDRQSKTAMKEWAQAWRAASSGNIEKAADHVFNLYKTFDDGVTPMSKEIVKDKQGNITGFNVRLKNDATGEERTQFIDKGALTEMGLSALSPPQMFEQAYKRKAEADKAAAEMRIKEAEEARAEGREIRKEVRGDVRKQAEEVRAEARDVRKGDREQENAIEKLTIEGQIKAASKSDEEKAKVKSKVDLLRQAGFSDDRINDMMPAIIGIGEFKKGTSPEEARRMIVTELIKDRNFNRKPQADKDKIIDDSMRMIYGRIPPKEAADAASAAANGLPAATSAPATPAAPADKRTSTGTIGGAPAVAATQTPAARPKGVPVWDSKTNSIIYINR